MKLYTQGDRSRAVCPEDGLVDTTFLYRDVPFEDGQGVVSNILVGVCDKCGNVVSTPPQSTPAIRRARERADKSIEVVLPAIYLDTLDLACYRIDSSLTSEFRKRLLMYYIKQYIDGDYSISELRYLRQKESIENSVDLPKRRLSLKVSDQAISQIDKIMHEADLSRTSLFRSLILKIWEEIVNPKVPLHLKELKTLMAVLRA